MFDNNNDKVADWRVPEIATANHYYPFGMLMPGRTLSTEDYRFGFNGQENLDDLKGVGKLSSFEFRCYDPRLGKFLSIDPLTSQYPFYTPYSFAGNKPIWALDLEGLEELIFIYRVTNLEKGTAVLVSVDKNYTSKAIPQHYPQTEMINKTTGAKFKNSEWGTIQQQYIDINDNKLDIKRDLDGKFIKGTGEIMPRHATNSFLPDGPLSNLGDFMGFGSNGTVYIGPENPTVIENGLERPDYRREPTDLVDAAALQHDKDYDALKQSGVSGALSTQTLGADLKLVIAANNVINQASKGEIDPYTNAPISKSTVARANSVIKGFGLLINNKLNQMRIENKK